MMLENADETEKLLPQELAITTNQTTDLHLTQITTTKLASLLQQITLDSPQMNNINNVITLIITHNSNGLLIMATTHNPLTLDHLTQTTPLVIVIISHKETIKEKPLTNNLTHD